MKKVLLTSLILSTVFVSFAQGIKSTFPGYAYDNFETENDYVENSGLGIFLSHDTVNFAVPYFKRVAALPTKQTNGIFKSIRNRKGDGKVSYTVSQPYGMFNFTPQLNVSFGEGKSINLTGNNSLSLTVGLKMDLASLANTINGVKIMFALRDANGVLIDSKGTLGGKSNQYLDEIYVTVDKTGLFKVPSSLASGTIMLDNSTSPGITYVTIIHNLNTQISYEVVYPKLTEFEYLVNENCVGDIKGDEGIKGASKPKMGFDVTKVVGFQLTLTQTSQYPGDCYYNQELTDFKFDFTGFILGNAPVSTSYLDASPLEIKNEYESSSNKLVAYPNPIKDGILNLSQNAEYVKVYDAIGNMVFTANNASKINVDGFAKGLYILKSSKGSTRFVVE